VCSKEEFVMFQTYIGQIQNETLEASLGYDFNNNIVPASVNLNGWQTEITLALLVYKNLTQFTTQLAPPTKVHIF
jgi:hypothetical protein